MFYRLETLSRGGQLFLKKKITMLTETFLLLNVSLAGAAELILQPYPKVHVYELLPLSMRRVS